MLCEPFPSAAPVVFVKLTKLVNVPPVVTLNTVPALLVPPPLVVPYSKPSLPCTSAPCGLEPMNKPVVPVKLRRVVITPAVVTLNTAPLLFAAPVLIVP